MKKLLIGLSLLAFAASSWGGNAACEIRFDTTTFDACQQQHRHAPEASALNLNQTAEANSAYQVIKFDRPISPVMRGRVEASGAEILGYLPDYAYLVRTQPGARHRLEQLDHAVWAGPFEPNWKLESNLVNALLIDDRPPAMPLTVALHRGVDADDLLEQVTGLPGVEHWFIERGVPRHSIVITVLGEALPELVESLATIDEVAHLLVRKVMQFHNSQGGWLHQSGEVDQLPIFDRGIFGCGQLVGVADSGVDFPHCAFADTVLGPPPVSDCQAGTACSPATPDLDQRKIPIYYKWSPAGDSLGDTSCPSGAAAGHGTHVAGSVLGNNPANAVDCTNFSTPGGLTDLDGTAPGAKLIAQEMGDALGYLNDLGGTVHHLVSVAFANGARVHNNSWGGSCCFLGFFCIPGCTVTYDSFTESADQAVWDFPEMALFFAAGNDGTCCNAPNSVGSPGNAKNTVTVGATQRGASGNNMAGFSSRGPTADTRIKPDIVAQGDGIVSVGSNGDPNTGSCGTCTLSGTSMASPTAAGMGALVREYLERGFYPTGIEDPANGISTISGALVKALMINGAHSMSGSGAGGGAPSQDQGWGRVLLDNSLYFDGDEQRLWLVDEFDGLETGQTHSYEIDIPGDQPLTISLVWHDFPGTIGAAVALVNQLRLEVEDPSGNVWTQKLPASSPFVPFADTSTSAYDNRNNVHQVRLDSPLAGTYQIRVVGINVPMGGSQPYALVANGDFEPAGAEPTFELSASPASLEVCIGNDAAFEVGVTSIADFADTVSLSIAAGLPAGASAVFDPNPVTPSDPATISSLTIATSSLAADSYALTVEGSSDGTTVPAITLTELLELTVLDDAVDATTLLAPADQAIDVDWMPSLQWQENNAISYQVQLASDALFNDLIVDESVSVPTLTLTSELAIGTEYFWRVRAIGNCADGDWSDTFSFTTRFEPLAEFSAASFSFLVAQDDLASDQLGISNMGNGSLSFAIETNQPAPETGACEEPLTSVGWLSVDPANGQVNEGDTEMVNLSVDTSGLAPGEYAAYLCIATNEDGGMLVEIPVTLEVFELVEAEVILEDLIQTYTGSALEVTIVTDPPGLAVEVSYDGLATPPTDVGSYEVIATITEFGFIGSATDSFMIEPATAEVILSNLYHLHTGAPITADVETVPADLNVVMSYDGEAEPPSAIGSYAVEATIEEQNWSGSASDILWILSDDVYWDRFEEDQD